MWSLKSVSAAKVVTIVVATVVTVATGVVATTAGMVTVATVVVTATVATVRSANHATRTLRMNLQSNLHHSHRPMMLIWHCNSCRNIYLRHPAPQGGMFFKIPFRFLIRHLQKSA